MNKKKLKIYSPLFNKEITIVIDESLRSAQPKGLAANKLAAANKRLGELKELPGN